MYKVQLIKIKNNAILVNKWPYKGTIKLLIKVNISNNSN